MSLEVPGDRPVVTTLAGADKLRVNVGNVFHEITFANFAATLKGGTPVLTVGPGAGTGPTYSLDANANDRSGRVTLVVGTSPATASIMFTLTFSTAFATAPHVVFSPSNVTAAALGGSNRTYIDGPNITTSKFDMMTGSAVSSMAGGTLIFDYHVLP